jgi:acetyl-CoA synthetase (ADP-forming)
MNAERFDDASTLIARALKAGRSALTEPEGKSILVSLGISVPQFRLIDHEAQVDEACSVLRPPFVLKVVSTQVLHKTEFGGVVLGLGDADSVRGALRSVRERLRGAGVTDYRWLIEEMAPSGLEIVVGAVTDPEFGPMVMVGLGGVFVEVLKDVAFRICPIEPIDAREMILGLRGAPLLQGARGQAPVSIDAIVDVLLKIGGTGGLMSLLADRVLELDINPLIVNERAATAVDARFILKA